MRGIAALRGIKSVLLACLLAFYDFWNLKWNFKATFSVPYYIKLNSCVIGVEILASAISVPKTNLNNINIIIKILPFCFNHLLLVEQVNCAYKADKLAHWYGRWVHFPWTVEVVEFKAKRSNSYSLTVHPPWTFGFLKRLLEAAVNSHMRVILRKLALRLGQVPINPRTQKKF